MRSRLWQWPLAASFVVGLLVVLAAVVALVEVGAISYAYGQLGIDRRWVYGLLVGSIAGSRINIPVARWPEQSRVSEQVVTVFGVRYLVPALEQTGETVLALNVGGAVIPAGLAAYLVVHSHLGWRSLVAALIVTVAVNRVARPVPGVGIAVPTVIPPVAAALAAMVLGGPSVAASAYVAGTIGSLAGADLLNLGRIRGLGAPVASIGGGGNVRRDLPHRGARRRARCALSLVPTAHQLVPRSAPTGPVAGRLPSKTVGGARVEFRYEAFEAEILDPERGFTPVRTRVQVRTDPLTGHTSRILPGTDLLPTGGADLSRLADETKPGCPFCPERIEQVTPMFPTTLCAAGRIRCGEAILFPNIVAYSKYSSVSVFSPRLHLLPLGEMTPVLVTDNLAAQVAFERAVMGFDPECRWASVNANYMPPSGSSVFHPHLQGAVHPEPTTVQRLLAETPADRFGDYLDAERQAGTRYLGSTGSIEWLVGFAPMGPAELRAFLPGIASPSELSTALVEEWGQGIATALRLYADLGFDSFNLALYGAPPKTAGYPLNLRIVRRSSVSPFYRSDATWLERLHWEAAGDVIPEELAERAKGYFRA